MKTEEREQILASFKNWKLIDHFADELIIDNEKITLVGFACENKQGVVLSGSAGGRDNVEDRAFYELLERLTVYENHQLPDNAVLSIKNGQNKIIDEKRKGEIMSPHKGEDWRQAMSNGVAIHQDFLRASNHAQFELLERDAVLASWYGLTLPHKKEKTPQPFPESYQVELYFFETLNGLHTAMALARPKKEGIPLLYGFGTEKGPEQAEAKAHSELIQRIGFLFDETADENMPFEPSALYLQEFYLRPENQHRIDSWLNGEHGAKGRSLKNATINFIDLTLPELKNYSIVKATSEDVIPLIFGKGYRIPGIEIKTEWELHPII